MEIAAYQETLQGLIDVEKKCEAEEKNNLAFYCGCFIRIFRAYHKTEQGEMLSYVREILKPAFPLVIRHFLEQANKYFETTEGLARVEIMLDIEESVIEFDRLFDAIVCSTNHADRLLFQTAPMETTKRYVPPKLCLYYSQLLSDYAGLFDKVEDKKYAFCVYPSLNQMAEAHILFQSRKKSGKVCVIRVPEHQFANVEMIRIWLLHEMFHVLPGEALRLRKKRQTLYLRVLLYYLEWRILKDCDWEKFGMPKEEVRRLLIKSGIDRIKAVLKKREGDERVAYSRPLKSIYVKEILDVLYEIQRDGQERFVDYILEKNDENENGVLESMSRLAQIRENFAQIRSNIYQISSCGEIPKACNFYMNIFRESFADLYTVITLHLAKEDYFNALEAFLRKENRSGGDYKERLTLLARASFVVNAMSQEYNTGTEEDMALLRQWRTSEIHGSGGLIHEAEQFRDRLFGRKSEKKESGALRTHGNLQESPIPVILNNKMVEYYQEYFVSCCGKYLIFRKDRGSELDRLEGDYMIKENVSPFKIVSGSFLCNNA